MYSTYINSNNHLELQGTLGFLKLQDETDCVTVGHFVK
jgi:hypothetical protein